MRPPSSVHWVVWPATLLLLLFGLSPLEVRVHSVAVVLRFATVAALFAASTTATLVFLQALGARDVVRWPFVALGTLTLGLLAIAVLPWTIAIALWMSPWQTVHVEYEHRAVPGWIVGSQWRDLGGLGYRKRTARVLELGPWLQYSIEIDEHAHPGSDWRAVDEHRNPFGWNGG